MSARDLGAKLSAYTLPVFDYAAIGDPDVERQVREATVKIREMQRAALVDIGRELIAVKAALPHGAFLAWVESSFGWSQRTAVNMMQVATEFGSKWETVSHLPKAVIYKLAAPSTPPTVREAVLHLGPGQAVSVRNVTELIDQVGRSDARKIRRARLKTIRQQDTAEVRAKWETLAERERVEHDRAVEAARAAAEQVRLLLGDSFSLVADLLVNVRPYSFADELLRLAQQNRDKPPAEEMP